jgi:methionyl-tRNA formyltransferase
MTLSLIYYGSGEFGLPSLKHLHTQHEIVAVISQPDRPAGRKRKLTPTPIAAWARAHDITLLCADDINEANCIEKIQQLGADAAVVIAYGQKLSPQIVEASGRLMVNLHGSLLPKYRGAAPINWAMINGEKQTGVSVISIVERMDAGLIYAQAATAIDMTETGGELHDRLALMGPTVLDQVLNDFSRGNLCGEQQDEALVTQSPKLSRADGTVDFTLDAVQVANRINGLSPWPGVTAVWCNHQGDELTLGLRRARADIKHTHDSAPGTILPGNLIATGKGAIHLLDVQVPGKRVATLRQFINGHPMQPGEQLRS